MRDSLFQATWNHSARQAFQRLTARDDLERKRKALALTEEVWFKAPRLCVPDLVPTFLLLAQLPHLRPVYTFVARGKGREAQRRSLIDHLLVGYPVPRFLYGVFDGPLHATTARWTRLFAWLAAGGSVRAAIDRGMLPVHLTRRMCHLFVTSPADRTPVEAVRHAQVTALGGDRELADRLCASRLGRELVGRQERFVPHLIQWFVGLPRQRGHDVVELVDYLLQRQEADPRFRVQGRSVARILEEVRRWHRELAALASMEAETFAPSGWVAAAWKAEVRVGPVARMDVEWSTHEMLSVDDLQAEGRAMRHCVFSYGQRIRGGRTSIWSLRRDGRRALTLEVSNPMASIVQVRGRFNRDPERDEIEAVRSWATSAGLKLRGRAW